MKLGSSQQDIHTPARPRSRFKDKAFSLARELLRSWFSPTALTTKAPHRIKEMPAQKAESFTPNLVFARLVKSGLLHKRHSEQLQQISAWAEVVGYVGSSTLSWLRIRASLEREAALKEDLQRRKKVCSPALPSSLASASGRGVPKKSCT